MSLLTKEQAAHVAYMRDLYCGPSGYDEIDELISIIDDLQARAPKQYTEQELVMIFQKGYPQYWHGMSGDYFQRGFREALRRVGALKVGP